MQKSAQQPTELENDAFEWNLQPQGKTLQNQNLAAQMIQQLQDELRDLLHAKKHGYTNRSVQSLDSDIDSIVLQFGKLGYDVWFDSDETDFKINKT